jgi:hypothetical protein
VSLNSTDDALIVNPLFVSAGSDFHLQAGSPAIHAGINVGLSTDYDGSAWYNPPSIGAYEYTSKSAQIPKKIEFAENNEKIKVYPNPVSDELIIEIRGNKDRIGFEILNSMGQSVFKGTLVEKTVVQTTTFSPGAYFLILYCDKSFEFKKIIKL